MTTPDYTQAKTYAYDRLERELSADLTYHNLWHTREDVVVACRQIGQLSGLCQDELQLLEVGAAYHDIGFTEHRANHELAGARISAQVLPQFGFSQREIECVMGMIIATRLPQSPRSLLEEIIADADLDVLGRDDFFARNKALREEWTNLGQKMGLKQWYEGQIAFLKSHTYFTPTARMLRSEKKKQHIIELEEMLQRLA